MIVREIECKSILTKCGIEAVDYALTPYVGCGHGCVYCCATTTLDDEVRRCFEPRSSSIPARLTTQADEWYTDQHGLHG